MTRFRSRLRWRESISLPRGRACNLDKINCDVAVNRAFFGDEKRCGGVLVQECPHSRGLKARRLAFEIQLRIFQDKFKTSLRIASSSNGASNQRIGLGNVVASSTMAVTEDCPNRGIQQNNFEPGERDCPTPANFLANRCEHRSISSGDSSMESLYVRVATFRNLMLPKARAIEPTA